MAVATKPIDPRFPQKEVAKQASLAQFGDLYWEKMAAGEYEESPEKQVPKTERPLDLPKLDLYHPIDVQPIESITFNERAPEVASSTSQDRTPSNEPTPITESIDAGLKWIPAVASFTTETVATLADNAADLIKTLAGVEQKSGPTYETEEEQEAAQRAEADFALLRNSAASLLQEESTIKQRTVEEIVDELFKLDVSADEVLGKLSPNDVKKSQLDLALFGKSDISMIVNDIQVNREEVMEMQTGPVTPGEAIFGNKTGDLFQGIENPNAPTKAVA